MLEIGGGGQFLIKMLKILLYKMVQQKLFACTDAL